MSRGFCFVFGCPRSGTTALTRLLHVHESVVMGMERYKHLLAKRRGRAAFAPALFEPERFFDFRKGDTNISPDAGKFDDHYAKARRRFESGTVRYVGDKVREDEPIISAIEAHFPTPRFFFIYRDLLDVASSFAVRARDPADENWPAAADHEAAVRRWHAAFATAEGLLARVGPEQVFVVRYDRLFDGEIRTCDSLFGFLGLEATAGVRRQFARRTAQWEQRQAGPRALSRAEEDLVLRRMDHDLRERFDRRFEDQFR
jgi:Sulfotransferase family